MMYKVILVDDEPVALKSMKAIIEKRCRDFQVVSTAIDGQEGLEIARKMKPDVIITDVKMPVMDGIRLSAAVKEELPDTFVVIISGYQYFEYAKGALEFGVCDYILKPIIPSELKKTMELLGERLSEAYWKKKNRLIRQICHGIQPDSTQLQKYFPASKYYGALIRRNGLPRRISTYKGIEIFSIKYEQMTMYGRDEQEGMYLYPEELLSNQDFGQTVQKMITRFQDGGYTTVVMSNIPFGVGELVEYVHRFYRVLAENTVVGKSQVLVLEDLSLQGRDLQDEQSCKLQEIECLAQQKKFDCILDRVKSLIEKWGEENRTQLWIEGKIRQILHVLLLQGYLKSTMEEIEFFMEDAFFYATSMDELQKSILSEIEKKKKDEPVAGMKMDTPEYFQNLKEYVYHNMAEPLTLQQICRHFGISQPYVSRIFRKYEGNSFSNYLTKVRIERAKELLEENEEMFIKDVAEMVGYNDQFYFSSIFRSLVGMCPTDFIKKINDMDTKRFNENKKANNDREKPKDRPLHFN